MPPAPLSFFFFLFCSPTSHGVLERGRRRLPQKRAPGTAAAAAAAADRAGLLAERVATPRSRSYPAGLPARRRVLPARMLRRWTACPEPRCPR